MPPEKRYLGYVESTFMTQKGLGCSLHPVAVASGAEIGVITDQARTGLFPNRGFVYWATPPADIQHYSMWEFQIEENFTYDASRIEHVKYRVVGQINPAIEILDLRGDHHSAIQDWLVTEGYFMPFRPSDSIYVWVADEQWVGPVSFVELAGQPQSWVLKDSCYQKPLTCYKPASDSSIIRVPIGSHSRIFSTSSRPGSKIGLVDWSPDATLLERVLKDLRHISPAANKSLGLTTKIVEALVAGLEKDGHISRDPVLERQRVQRAQGIIARLNGTLGILAKLESELLNLPAIHVLIEQASDHARSEATQKIHDEMAQERAALAALHQESHTLAAQISQQTEEIERQRDSIEQQVSSVDQSLQERLASVMRAPEDFLAEIALLRAGFGALPMPVQNPVAAPQNTTMSSVDQKVILPWPQSEGTVTDVKDAKALRVELRNRARLVGLAPHVDGLHASFISGAMPILAGAGALDLLEAYAGGVAGGRLLWIPISPRIVDSMDLIGHASPMPAGFIPATGGIADVLVQAQLSDDMYVVVLDGINRASIDSYLMPLLASYGRSAAKRTARRLSMAHPSSLSTSDPYYSLTNFAWPPNVLLAGVLSEGITTLQPSPTLWQYATLNIIAQPNSLSSDAISLTYTQVTATNWTQLQEVQPIDYTPLREVLTELQEQVPGLDIPGFVERFYAARMAFAAKQKQALRETLIQCLIPIAVAIGSDEIVLEHLNPIFDGDDHLRPAHQHISRALR